MSPARRDTVLVVGATGTTGQRVVERLSQAGASVLAASRHPHPGPPPGVAFDWYDPASTRAVLDTNEVRAMYLVPPVRDPDPAAVMVPFLQDARAASVSRVVLLGAKPVSAGDSGIGRVYGPVAELFDEWAVLRPAWFMQDFTGGHYLAAMLRSDAVLRTATGQGKIAFIDASDIAAVAAAALLTPSAPNRELVITGPEALSYPAVAEILTEVTGVTVSYDPLSQQQMTAQLSRGMPPAIAAYLARGDRDIAERGGDEVTDVVHEITGQPPTDLRTFAARAWAAQTLRVHTAPPAT